MTNPERANDVVNLEIPNDWRKVKVCGLSLSMPSSLKEKTLQPHDSCIGTYEDGNMRISIDVISVGIEEKIFTRRSEYANMQEFTVKESSIDGFKAEIINGRDDNKPKLHYTTVLDLPERGLTIWIYTIDLEKQKLANQVAHSVRFDH